ncbi:MAG TPA: hypothetical protein VHA53_00410, partial [Nitrolancea sp.]|nr:hypothetical protein [Nitrolancea sp.]
MLERLLLDANHLTAGEHDFQILHVVARRTNAHRMGASRIDSDHPPNRRDGRSRWIRREVPTEGAQDRIESIAHETRLHADGFIADLLDPPHVPREVDNETASERLTGNARPGAPRDHRDMHLGAVLDDGDHVVAAAGEDNSQGGDLIQAPIVRVHRHGQRIAAEISLQKTREVVDYACLRVVHD